MLYRKYKLSDQETVVTNLRIRRLNKITEKEIIGW
jgi:hypothetical protein